MPKKGGEERKKGAGSMSDRDVEITVRLPSSAVSLIDALVKHGVYRTRDEAVRSIIGSHLAEHFPFNGSRRSP